MSDKPRPSCRGWFLSLVATLSCGCCVGLWLLSLRLLRNSISYSTPLRLRTSTSFVRLLNTPLSTTLRVQHSFKGCFIASKSIEEAVEDKALKRGSKLFHVSSYRNSKVCPIHFVRLERTDDWHTLKCPLGHYVDRDHASVMNMNWKLTPEAWVKGVWWNMKREMNWRKHENKSNPIIPHPIMQYIHAMLKTFTASEESPAVLARGSPMNHHRMQNEGGGEETSHALLGQGGGQHFI